MTGSCEELFFISFHMLPGYRLHSIRSGQLRMFLWPSDLCLWRCINTYLRITMLIKCILCVRNHLTKFPKGSQQLKISPRCNNCKYCSHCTDGANKVQSRYMTCSGSHTVRERSVDINSGLLVSNTSPNHILQCLYASYL